MSKEEIRAPCSGWRCGLCPFEAPSERIAIAHMMAEHPVDARVAWRQAYPDKPFPGDEIDSIVEEMVQSGYVEAQIEENGGVLYKATESGMRFAASHKKKDEYQ